MKAILSSELIINPDGSIYHLNLKPDEIAPMIITVGDPGRVAMVSKYFDEVEVVKQKREFLTHTGRIGKQRISVISTGIGPDNIDIVFNEVDALVNIDFETKKPKDAHTALHFIRIGTSGSLQKSIPVDSFLVSSYGVGLDNLLSFYEYKPNLGEAALVDELTKFSSIIQPIPFYVAEGSSKLITHIGGGMHHGITLTAPGFYGPQGRSLRLKARYDASFFQKLSHFQFGKYKITNLEMETAAIYSLCRLLGHQALSTNVILANREQGTFSSNPKDAVDKLIKTVLERISE